LAITRSSNTPQRQSSGCWSESSTRTRNDRLISWKNQIGAHPVDWQVADFVDDQQPRRDEHLQLLVQPAFSCALVRRRDQVGRAGEQHPVTGLDGFQAQRDRRVRSSRRAEHDHAVAMLDEVAAGQLLHLLAVGA
jgi:hypothetical protein